MNPEFDIQGRKIGYDHDPLVIAEIGINHGGSLTVAKEMVDAAKRAGAEVVKHQTHVVADEMTDHARRVIPGNADKSIYEIMAECALSEDDERQMKDYVEEQGMIFISTPFSRAAADRLERFDLAAYKIGSGECNNYPLIEHVAGFGRPMILSTGMNSLESIAPAVEIMERHGVPYALLHCTNVYPTPAHLIRLGAIQELQQRFPRAVVGLSDHSLSNLACFGAIALGASIVERHFTDHMEREGPDVVCSMDEAALRDLIAGGHELRQMRGGSKGRVAEEQVTSDFAFASVCTIADIRSGDRFSSENLWVKRPGTGDFLADDYTSVLGKTAARDIARGEQLKSEDVAD